MPDMIKEYGPPSVFATWGGERNIHTVTEVKTNLNPGESSVYLKAVERLSMCWGKSAHHWTCLSID